MLRVLPFPFLLACQGGSVFGPATGVVHDSGLPQDTVDTAIDEPPPTDDAQYSATAVPTALDRVHIVRHEVGPGLCATISVASPTDWSPFEVQTPVGWSVESIGAFWVGATCGEPPGWQGTQAGSATGEITFAGTGEWGYPARLGLDVTAVFDDPDLPQEIRFYHDDLPVDPW